MEITVLSRSKDKRELIKAVASLYAQTLNVDNSKYELTIATVSGLAKADKINGGVCLIGPKYLLMTLDSRLDIEQLMITLAHEMVHVKQYAKGQLKVKYNRKCEPRFIWMGRKYNKDYYDMPWEIEAFSRERILANKISQIIEG